MVDQATLNARVDNSGTKPQLVIDGTVLVYASNFAISVELADPPGLNPTIALFHVLVKEVASPMKGVMQPFHKSVPFKDDRWTSAQVAFAYEPEEGSQDRVQSVTADIEF